MKGKNYLSAREEIRSLLRSGRRIHSDFFTLIARKNSLPHPRFVCIASKNVNKRAVRRNLLKRRAREWLRIHASALQPPMDIAVVFKKGAADGGPNALSRALTNSFEKIPGR